MQPLLDRLYKAEKYFKGTKYNQIVEESTKLYWDGKYSDCVLKLNELPTEEKLLTELIEKLKGKSIYDVLKRLHEKKNTNDFMALKGLFSLGTHVAIELEKGNSEYKILIPTVLEKINQLGFEIC